MSNLVIYAGIFVVAFGVIVCFVLRKKRKDEVKEHEIFYEDDKTAPEIEFFDSPYGTIVVIESGVETKFHPIPEKGLIVGRDPEQAQLVISNKYVSKAHLRIVPEGDEYIVVDLASTNGTYIDDERITERKIKSNKVIKLGKSGFVKLKILKENS